ncbi:hypothetical protein IC575_021628 [Cucumis melo]
MIVFAVVLYGSVEKCACILVLDLMHCRCLLLVCHGCSIWKCGKVCLYFSVGSYAL